MCNRHSFAVTKDGKVIDGYGLTDSHLPLAELATKGAYLYGVTDEGVCYVIRGEKV